MIVAAVLTAAGSGTRLGLDLPKALASVAGAPLVAHAYQRLTQVADRVVVTAPIAHLEKVRAAVPGAMVVAGGTTRQKSVARGLDTLELDDDDIVLIHDAARAFQTVEVLAATVARVRAGADGAVPVIPVVDTLVGAPGPTGDLGDPIDRSDVRIVQTPQTFRARVALAAHEDPRADATDDATLARDKGYRVVAIEGHAWGFKVTHPADLALAEHVANEHADSAS